MSWNVNGSAVLVDTLYHATVGPGITETELRVTQADRPDVVNNLFYATVDLDNPYIEMRAAKAGNAMRYVETVPEISARFSSDGADYIVGVNADFFNTSYPYNPLGATIGNGALANYTTPADQADIDSYYIYFNSRGVPSLARHVVPAEAGSVIYPTGNGRILRVNRRRGADQLVIYTPQWEFINDAGMSQGLGSTGTNKYGAEVLLKPLGGATMWGDVQLLRVAEAPVRGVGNMRIDPDGYVLSAHGDAIDEVMKLEKDDVVKAYMGIKADGKTVDVRELIAGFPFLIVDGAVQPVPGYPAHLSTNEPRTAVGFNKDKSRLTLLVVDGRNAGGSVGITQSVLASYMANLGCSDAMNFDGGGSSTMFVKPVGGVRNVPSRSSLDKWRPEGHPRVVVNALFAVNTAPDDPEVVSIEIREKRLDLTTGQRYIPTVYGYNKYGTLVDDDLSGFECVISSRLASVEDGCLTAASGNCRGDLTVRYGNASYSIPVYINGGEGDLVSSGADEILIDGSHSPTKVEYFSTLGIRIQNPAPGSFVIEKSGNRVRKTIIRP